jgi:hypothetical protein
VLLELEVLAVPVPQEFRFWAGVGRWKKEEGRRKREEAVQAVQAVLVALVALLVLLALLLAG